MSAEPSESPYYLANFLLMVPFAFQRYSSFFEEDEQKKIQNFLQLSENAQALFVRLFNRKGHLFRYDKINYPEIDLSKATTELAAESFLHLNASKIETLALLETLTIPDLKKLASLYQEKATGKRADILALLLPLCEQNLAVLTQHYQWIVLYEKPLFLRLMVLFFCNRHQSMTQFVLVHLGQTAYENYPIEQNEFFFSNRASLESYLKWGEEKDSFMDHCFQKNLPVMEETVERLLKLEHFDFPWSRMVYRMIFRGIKAYEIAKEWQKAEDAYEKLLKIKYHFDAAARYIHCLEKRFQHDTALEAAQNLIQQTDSMAEKLFFQFHINKNEKALKKIKTKFSSLKKAKVVEFRKEQTENYQGSKATFWGRNKEPLTVENIVLEEFKIKGWEGVFAENSFILSLACILCWDILYAPLSGVFQHPYQSGPLDLSSSQFYPARKNLFTKRFEWLKEASKEVILEDFLLKYEEKKDISCALNSVASFPVEVFTAFLLGSNGSQLATLLQSLFQSLGEKSRGFPDLVLWNNSFELKIVEVKGPKDKLSEEQKLWLHLLIECGYQAEIARIIDSSLKRV